MLNTLKQLTKTTALLLTLAILFSLAALPLTAGAFDLNAWYKEQAGLMLDDIQELSKDNNYLSKTVAMPDAQNYIIQWRETMDEKVPVTYVFKAPTLTQVLKITGEGGLSGFIEGLGEVARKRMEDSAVMMLANYAGSVSSGGQNGAYALIAGSALNIGKMLEKPEGFENTVVVYEYDTFVVTVSFRDGGPAVSVNAAIALPAFLEKLQEIQ
ncbi:MAG: hypothetical protein QM308_02120 [Bacillota bacterium]|nr:hypothetical protein [Bacillota bacterium]